MRQIVLAVFFAGLCVGFLELYNFLGHTQARASARSRVLVIPEHVYLSAHRGDILDLVIEGTYPNSCYRDGAYEVQVDHRAKQLVILSYASVPSNILGCEPRGILYSRQLRVAGVEPGRYKVYFQGEGQTPEYKGELLIPENSAGFLASLQKD